MSYNPFIILLKIHLNDKEELEARFLVLEESMVVVEEDLTILQNGFVTLTDDIDNVEFVNILQDKRVNTLEASIFDNENDIRGLLSTSYM